MKKIYSLLFALACIGMMHAGEQHVLINGLYYNLGATQAEVTYKSFYGNTDSATWAADQRGYVSGNLVIPDHVTYKSQTYTVIRIGSAAFAGCENLTSVVIPNTVVRIDGYSDTHSVNNRQYYTGAFGVCKNLRSVTLSTTDIAPYAFARCEALEELTINQCYSIQGSAFDKCTSLKRIVFPEGLTRIYSMAFESCSSLQSIEFPSTLTTIEHLAFVNCTSLDTIVAHMTTPPDIYQEILGQSVFYNAGADVYGLQRHDGLRDMKLFVPLESLSAYKATPVWGDCHNIYAIGYDVYTSNGIRYKRDPAAQTAAATFISYDARDQYVTNAQKNYVTGDVVIPQTFTDDHNITYTVTVIDEFAFNNCQNLSSIQLPPTITKINERAFCFNRYLANINFPEGLVEIGSNAFYSCSSKLKEIDLPSTLTNIKTMAFYNCQSLRTITARMTTLPTMGSYAFGQCASNMADITCYVPADVLSTYQTADVWKNFTLKTFVPSISSVSLTVNWPRAGKEVISDQAYGPNEVTTTILPEGAQYSVSSYKFYKGVGNSIPFGETTLEENTQYRVKVEINVNEDNRFSNTVDVKVNNQTPEQIENNSTTLTFFTTFTTGNLPSPGFSVSADKHVRFAKGNLQYQPSTETWQFAEHQYDYVGANNSSISSSTYKGWIDLFGWGTGDEPTKYVNNNANYADYHEWGANPISNGGNKDSLWYTLTVAEWNYLFNTREDHDFLYGRATVASIKGMLVLPDNWNTPAGLTFTPVAADFTTNTYTADQWNTMEEAGAIFLPCAGMRSNGTSIVLVGDGGYYWTSSPSGSDYGNRITFNASTFNPSDRVNRKAGQAVRLARDYTEEVVEYTVRFLDWDSTVLSTQTVEQGQNAVAPQNPTREGYVFTGWDKDFTNIQEDVDITAVYKIPVTEVAVNWTSPNAGQSISNYMVYPRDSVFNIVGHIAEAAGWEVKYYMFYRKSGSIFNTFSGTFQVGDTYRVNIYARAKAGYSFPMTEDDPSKPDTAKMTITINGEKPQSIALPWYSSNNQFTGDINISYIFTVSATPTYAVTFYDWDGTVLSAQTVAEGQNATAPSAPSREGYLFVGWDKEFTNIHENLDITAVYKIPVNEVAINWTAPNPGQSISNYIIYKSDSLYNVIGHIADATDWFVTYYTFYKGTSTFTGTFQGNETYKVYIYVRAKEGYIFPRMTGDPNRPDVSKMTVTVNGEVPPSVSTPYYSSNHQYTGDLCIAYNFTVPATPTYTVTFYNWDGTVLSTQTVEEGQNATAPADPTREGYLFAGWDKGFTNITANTDVYATYTQLVTVVDVTATFPQAGDEVHNIVLTPTHSMYNNYGSVSVEEDAGYEVALYGIYNSAGNWPSETTFKYDTEYQFLVGLQVKEGYDFPRTTNGYPDITKIAATINGERLYDYWCNNKNIITLITMFKTSVNTGVEESASRVSAPQKILRDNQILIVMPDGTTYNVLGMKTSF